MSSMFDLPSEPSGADSHFALQSSIHLSIAASLARSVLPPFLVSRRRRRSTQFSQPICSIFGTNDGGGNRCWETLHAADPTTATQLARSRRNVDRRDSTERSSRDKRTGIEAASSAKFITKATRRPPLKRNGRRWSRIKSPSESVMILALFRRRFSAAIIPRYTRGNCRTKGFSENSIINFVAAASRTAMTAARNAEADDFALSPFFFGDVISSGTL